MRQMKKQLFGILFILAVFLFSGSVFADDWSVFTVNLTTKDKIAIGKTVTFSLTIENTKSVALTPNIYPWYYREAGNSETYPGEEFGTVKGSGYSAQDQTISLAANGKVKLTLTGKIPSTWTSKSQIAVVVADVKDDYYGQYEYQSEVTDTLAPPKAPAGVKAKAKKNKVTVSWKKSAEEQIEFIEVQYATNKKFTKGVKTKKVAKNKTSLKLKLKKKKTYYVRVRYKGAVEYSKWSGVKKVKTKK